MVLTRRQAREDQLTKNRKAQELEIQGQADTRDTSGSRHLSRANTRIEISPSATGKGTHTRWIRRDPVHTELTESSITDSQQDVKLDERFITPAPLSFPTPSAPQKARESFLVHKAAASPPIWKIEATMQNIEEEIDVDEAPPTLLGSPFSGQGMRQPATTPRPLRLEPTVLVVAEPSPAGSIDTEILEDSGLRRAFGPHGTHLYNARGEEIFV